MFSRFTTLLSISLLLLLLLPPQTNAQHFKFEKEFFSGNSENDYYLAARPSGDIIGTLVLLPGFGLPPESIFPESGIYNAAYNNGLFTISLAAGPKLYADQQVIDRINRALEHAIEKYHLPREQFIVGGFSAGGTVILRYAQYTAEHPDKAPVQPKGVFSVDSPVDLFDIWNYFDRELKKNYSEAGVGEARYVRKLMASEIGTPDTNPEVYKKLTPFFLRSDAPGNEKYLKNMAVRVYHDIDVSWQLKNRRRSLLDNNSLAASEMINRLLLMGNESAEFMQAKSPGYRSNGTRHPHSWSIVDETELVQWAQELLSSD